jgi:hypothetical protein
MYKIHIRSQFLGQAETCIPNSSVDENLVYHNLKLAQAKKYMRPHLNQ